jgi:DNA-binding beta-propeller fold protein YncE
MGEKAMKRRQRCFRGLALGFSLLLLAAANPPLWSAQENQGSESVDGATSNLVWPMPPYNPRIRWVDKILEFADVTGKRKEKKKLSWFERLAGAKQEPVVEPRLARPYGIAVDSRGRVFVADVYLGKLIVFDQANKVVEEWNDERAAMMQPIGVAVDAQDRVFVSDAKLRTLNVFGPDGNLISQFGQMELERPTGLAIDRKRELLYVGDAKAHQVVVFDLNDFSLVRRIGDLEGSDASGVSFYTPANLAVDRRGFLYVSDAIQRRVLILNRRGRLVHSFGQAGDGPGDFGRPKGIAVDSEGHIYVADGIFNNFQIFDQEGNVLFFVGSRGFKPGQFLLMAGLYIDDRDRIYVTDMTGRLQIFQYLPEPEIAAEGGETDKKKERAN